jgi:hypothetical protein
VIAIAVAATAGAARADKSAVTPSCLDDQTVAAKVAELEAVNAKHYAEALKQQKLVPANLVRHTWPLASDELTPFDKIEMRTIAGRKVRVLLAGTIRMCNPLEPKFVRRGKKIYRVQLKLKAPPGYATQLQVCGCEPIGGKCDGKEIVDVGLGFELPRNLGYGGVLEVETLQEGYALYYGIAPKTPCPAQGEAR